MQGEGHVRERDAGLVGHDPADGGGGRLVHGDGPYAVTGEGGDIEPRADDVADLKPGMVLEGTVTNVAAFGAFVDIGVHQDGLVHVSQLADKFVKNPQDVVRAGDIVKVRVVDVDLKRQRIALSMKRDDGSAAAPAGARGDSSLAPVRRSTRGAPTPKSIPAQGALGTALFDALRRK